MPCLENGECFLLLSSHSVHLITVLFNLALLLTALLPLYLFDKKSLANV